MNIFSEYIYPLIWALIISFGLLLTSYVLGIIAVEYFKIPVPYKVSKKLAALIIGFVILAVIVYFIFALGE